MKVHRLKCSHCSATFQGCSAGPGSRDEVANAPTSFEHLHEPGSFRQPKPDQAPCPGRITMTEEIE